jgi:SAM-dependent methyltransferase
MDTSPSIKKTELAPFLARNPFPRGWTFGFFFREKMRAIHDVAPQSVQGPFLEIGGGQSGLTQLLYPGARVINIDIDERLGRSEANLRPGMGFVCGDAARLPFADRSFGCVTLFDLLEHVPDDDAAASEILRVLRPGGVILLSTPNERWRYPYYRPMAPFCPTEDDLFREWGHVRRGYRLDDLVRLFRGVPEATSSFNNALTVVSHDVAFSRLPWRVRHGLCMLLWPVTFLGYGLRPLPGTEIVGRWSSPEN